MLPTLVPIGALLAGIALLLLGSGLLNTVVSLRGNLEGFSETTLGLIGSTYFLGFFLGTFVAPKLIRRMGISAPSPSSAPPSRPASCCTRSSSTPGSGWGCACSPA